MYVPFFRPDMGTEEIENVVRGLKSGWLTTGPTTEQFEKNFAAYIGGDVQAVAVNSATAALHLGLEALIDETYRFASFGFRTIDSSTLSKRAETLSHREIVSTTSLASIDTSDFSQIPLLFKLNNHECLGQTKLPS